MGMNPESVYRSLLEAGTAWAEAHCKAAQLEDGMKPLLSQLTIEAKLLEGCSMAEATAHALSSGAYRQSIIESTEARKEANICKMKLNSIEALFAAQRTVAATERAAQGHQA
jgi:hypothetical protein